MKPTLILEPTCCNNCPFLTFQKIWDRYECNLSGEMEISGATVVAMATDKNCRLLKEPVMVKHKEQK